MAGIRKQAITSSILVYIGILIGVFNMYFFVRNGSFTADQYGLTRLFFDVGQNVFVLASLGSIPVLYKFYPYYKDNLADKENDLLTRTLIISVIGFIVVTLAGIVFEPLVVRKFSERSKLFVDYYHWVFPFAFGLLFFSILEGYAWVLHKTVLSNFLKETALRLVTTIFILLYYFKFITFQHFMWLFSFLYLIIAIILFIYLIQTGHLHLHFKKSRVTKKFRKKMLGMQSLIFGGYIITTIGQTIDGIIIASLKGLTLTGVYTFAQYVATLIQVPQRSIQSISTGILVREWKEKNFAEINRIYARSCINMLLLAIFICGNIWLNVREGMKVTNIQSDFTQGISAIFIIGISRMIDAGTGVNGTIIGTSNKWKFEFFSGVIMLAIRIPLAYYFVKTFGIIGSAYAELISLSIYNFIRFEFIRRKFGMQPFSFKTVYSILLGIISFLIPYFLFSSIPGWPGILIRSAVFSLILIAAIFTFKLTPDAMQLLQTVRKRLHI